MVFYGLIVHFFSVLNNISLPERTNLFTSSLTEEHVVGFQVLTILSKAAIDICVQKMCVCMRIFREFR